MNVGVLPAVGSGLATMAGTGQLGRLIAHLERYGREFTVWYFSYLPLSAETPHRLALPDGVHACIQPRWATPKRALLWPLLDQRAWRDLDVCRALNLLGAIPALTAKWAWGIPFIISYGADYHAIARIHGRSALHLRKWGWLQRLVFRSAAAVLVSREDLAARFRQEYPAAHIIFNPNWIDGKRFSPAETPARNRRVLYVGRLVEEKNLLRLARAVHGIWGARLRCVGEGPLQWALGGNHPASERAECPGPRDWAELPEEYRAAGCFVLPSLTEGHPKALLEAMACFPAETFVVTERPIAWHRRRYSGPLIIIRTSRGIVRVTPEHPFMTDSGWVLASRLTRRHQLVYSRMHETIAKAPKRQLYAGRIGEREAFIPSEHRQGNRYHTWAHQRFGEMVCDATWLEEILGTAGKIQSTVAIVKRVGICRWPNRWRRDSDDPQERSRMETSNIDCEYFGRVNELALGSYPDAFGPSSPVWNRPRKASRTLSTLSLCVPRDRLSAILPAASTIARYQGQTAKSCNRMDGTSPQADVAGGIFAPTIRHYPADSVTEYQAIKEITNEHVTNLEVYNLTTPSETYLACGYLVHNCGLPVAVSDRVGVIRHEETGLVFRAEDEADMRRQIARLLDDPDLAARLGTAARKDVERYDIDRLMPTEIDILRGAAR